MIGMRAGIFVVHDDLRENLLFVIFMCLFSNEVFNFFYFFLINFFFYCNFTFMNLLKLKNLHEWKVCVI